MYAHGNRLGRTRPRSGGWSRRGGKEEGVTPRKKVLVQVKHGGLEQVFKKEERRYDLSPPPPRGGDTAWGQGTRQRKRMSG